LSINSTDSHTCFCSELLFSY